MLIYKRGLRWFLKRINAEYHSPTKKISKYIKLFIIKFKFNNKNNHINRIKKDFLYFIFDLDVIPLAYDVAGYLASADLERQKLNLKYIYIVILPGREYGFRLEIPEYDSVVNIDERNFRFWNIVVPMFNLLPSFKGFKICQDRNEANLYFNSNRDNNYFPNNWREEIPTYPLRIDIFGNSIDKKFNILNLRATNKAIFYVNEYLKEFIENRKLIVITIRQYNYSPDRNSNIDNWLKFADSLDKKIYEVLLIPDTNHALLSSNLFYGRRVLEVAAFNIEIRMAIYEAAYLNLAINQGPMELCWYNIKCNYIMFFKSGKSQLTSTKQLLKEGIIENKNPLFSKKYQKWVWDNDDLELIIKEFNLMITKMENSDVN